ncbi:cytochrome P450 monooxygenase-like protein [Xylogone sp. PMI_703]|nr:cytochrome P450 monooxygenase-like protein [Xylogone sp. PMI_703]
MVSVLTGVILAIPLYLIWTTLWGFRRNIAAAKRSGLPYIITPIYMYNSFWLVGHRLWIPLIKKNLPRSWWENWIDYMEPDWPWHLLHEPFKKLGDVWISVSSTEMIIWLANAEAIHQVTSRREAFPKPLESYRLLDLFGRNVVTTEGAEWKQHRKISSPSFNEKNNALVFAESIAQSQAMLRKWMGSDYRGNMTVEEVPLDTMRVTLHIISRVGFGVRLLWPGESLEGVQNSKDAGYSSHIPPPGYTMSFEASLRILLDRIPLVLLAPAPLLKYLPFESTREAYESFTNWGKYMKELFAQKVQKARTTDSLDEGMDIMGALARSSYGNPTHGSSGKKQPVNRLSDSEILGNAFVVLLAGHETTANSVHFSLVELAIRPKIQRLMQKDVESIFGDTPPEQWNYDASINSLLGGILGAVLNEELRVMPSVIGIPKMVTKDQDQTIELDGQMVTLPKGAKITLISTAVQRNPRYWPSKPSKVTGKEHDLDEFKPERWLERGAGNPNAENINDSTDLDDFGGFTGHSSSARLFHPVRGSYIPFSDGARSCLGRRLAQVEVMAIFAVIFQKFSVELAVDEWATDEEVARMTVDQKSEVYKKAQMKARETLKSASTRITLKLQDGFIPLRFMRKGEERFIHLFDD